MEMNQEGIFFHFAHLYRTNILLSLQHLLSKAALLPFKPILLHYHLDIVRFDEYTREITFIHDAGAIPHPSICTSHTLLVAFERDLVAPESFHLEPLSVPDVSFHPHLSFSRSIGIVIQKRPRLSPMLSLNIRISQYLPRYKLILAHLRRPNPLHQRLIPHLHRHPIRIMTHSPSPQMLRKFLKTIPIGHLM